MKSGLVHSTLLRTNGEYYRTIRWVYTEELRLSFDGLRMDQMVSLPNHKPELSKYTGSRLHLPSARADGGQAYEADVHGFAKFHCSIDPLYHIPGVEHIDFVFFGEILGILVSEII